MIDGRRSSGTLGKVSTSVTLEKLAFMFDRSLREAGSDVKLATAAKINKVISKRVKQRC